MTDAPDGWPDPQRPGVPANSERERTWHWLQGNTETFACWWYGGYWTTPIGDCGLVPEQVADWRYLGCCLTPQEVAAREAAAAQAMREACAAAGSVFGPAEERAADRARIMATPLPAPAALAREIAAAEARGMERAAGIAQNHADKWSRDGKHQAAAGGDVVAAAIRAAAKEIKA